MSGGPAPLVPNRELAEVPIAKVTQYLLNTAHPDGGLKAGDVGTVVHVASGSRGYMVEFCTLTGATIAVAPVEAGQIRPVEAQEVSSARRIAG